jgi:hypothetical protein
MAGYRAARPGLAPVAATAEIARADAIGNQREAIGQRMPDKARVDAVFGVDRWLHREQAQHAVGAAADFLRALFAPRPDRRADVVHGAQAGLLQALLHAEIEIRRVDADDYRGLHLEQFRPISALAQSQQSRQMADHLAETEQRQFVDVVPGFETLCLHAGAADADEARMRIALTQAMMRSAPSWSPESSPAIRAMSGVLVETSMFCISSPQSGSQSAI